MKIRYLSQSANSILCLDYAVRELAKYARRDFDKVKALHSWSMFSVCPDCEHNPVILYTHHLKPLWACAVDTLLSCHPQSMEHLAGLTSMAFHGTLNICDWNHPSNLRQICRYCHEKVQMSVDDYWKEVFRSQGVMFTNREVRECLRGAP